MYGPDNYGVYNQYPDKSLGDWPDTGNKTLGKLQSQIRNNDFDAGSAFAETEKTIAGILNSTRIVLDLWRSAARLDLPGFLRALARLPQGRRKREHGDAVAALKAGDISAAFLAVRYGWEPLINDVWEGIIYFETRLDNRVAKFKAAASRQETLSYGFVGYRAMVEYHQIIAYRCNVTSIPSEWRLLGLNNPLGIAWERVPFSFVVDWFIPIGNYFSVLAFFSGLSATYAKTEYWRATYSKSTGMCANGQGSPHYIYCNVPGPNFVRHETVAPALLTLVEVYRTPNVSLSVTPPSFKSLGKVFSTEHLENAAALIHQLIGNAKGHR